VAARGVPSTRGAPSSPGRRLTNRPRPVSPLPQCFASPTGPTSSATGFQAVCFSLLLFSGHEVHDGMV
jgi:hypothetical protein